jgi:hypothetical protein
VVEAHHATILALELVVEDEEVVADVVLLPAIVLTTLLATVQ